MTLLERHLDSVVEGLIPLLLSKQLDTIHENIQALGRKNTDWVEICLYDAANRQMYPLAGVAPPAPGANTEIRTVERRVDYLDMRLGRLVVSIDVAPSLAGERSHHHLLLLALLGIVATLAVVSGLVLELAVIRPARSLAAAARELARRNFEQPLPPPSADEVGMLAQSFAAMREDMRNYQDELLHEILERRRAEEALKQLNETLAARIQEEVAKNREKDHLLIQQSRLAAMGEMVHNIAHQWRQPLTSLGLLVQNMAEDFRGHYMTNETLARDVKDAQSLLDRMSTTIDDFRRFFRPDRERVVFDAAQAARDGAFIIGAALRSNHIEITLDLPTEPLWISGFPGQYAQAVLNLLMNAKEAITGKQRMDGHIVVRLAEDNGSAAVSVEDNAGGIPAEVLPRIFDPYFTTKEQGSGIGLYMVKMIVEKNMNGQVEAGNGEQGARFVLRVPLSGAPPNPTGVLS